MFWQQSLHQIALKGSNTCHHVAMRKDFGGNTVGVFYKQTFQQALSFQPLFLFQHLYFSAKMKRQHISFSLACEMNDEEECRGLKVLLNYWAFKHLYFYMLVLLVVHHRQRFQPLSTVWCLVSHSHKHQRGCKRTDSDCCLSRSLLASSPPAAHCSALQRPEERTTTN